MCVCTRAHVCAYARACVCVRARMCVRARAHVCARERVCVRVCGCVRACECENMVHACVCIASQVSFSISEDSTVAIFIVHQTCLCSLTVDKEV